MHPDEGFHDHAGTVMVIAWGQFIDHDYTLTATPLGMSKKVQFVFNELRELIGRTKFYILISHLSCYNTKQNVY